MRAERLKFAIPDHQQMLKREKRKSQKSERANCLLVHFFVVKILFVAKLWSFYEIMYLKKP